ncbi:MAG: LamG-like jellyroll fold domain-containing protein [Ferruginibacter sp.]
MIKLYPLLKKTKFNYKNYIVVFLISAIGLLTANSVNAQNNSFNFDGVNDYIQLPVVLTGDYTKELWFKANAITGNPQNLLTGESTAIYVDATGNLGGGNLIELSDPTPIVPGQWYHVAVTFNVTTGVLNLYKDGILVSSGINTNGLYEPYLQIGAYQTGFNFGGNIDEVRIYNIERSSAQILADMNCEISHQSPGLVAYYNFNQGVANGNNTSQTNLKDVANNCVPLNGIFNNVALTGTVSNFTSDVPATFTGVCSPEAIIRVSGASGICIDNGDVSPSPSDGTDFGIAVESSNTNSFIIRNTGTQNLDITSILSSSLNFTPNFTTPVSIAPGDSYTFTITFNQSVIPGPKTGTITIYNNDANFSFDVIGINAFKGKALNFDGQFSFVQTNVSLNGSYTKEAWINLEAIPALAGNIITGQNSALYIDNAGNLGGGNLTEVTDPTGPVIIGVWTHVAVTYDAATNTTNLYKNGILVNSASPASPFTNDGPQQIGAFNSSFLFQGDIDEVRIWSVVRTPAEILSSFSCRIPDDAPGLVAYYDFDQGVASQTNTNENILFDITCAHNDATLINFALTGNKSNWVAPGAPIILYCEGNVPNIRVTGLGKCIFIGDSPSTTTGTDFGFYSAPGVDGTFTVFNTGVSPLIISGVSISGTGAAGFTIISGGGASTVQPGDSLKIVVRFIHTINETLNAVLTITNNDPNEGTYNIPIRGTGVAVTPVTLLTFTGQLEKNIVNLKWSTTTEINNAGFEILRLNDVTNTWEKIGYVSASGIETGTLYKFTDIAPLVGVNTYRLKQIDKDGVYKMSNIISVNNLTKVVIVKTYPNPFVDRVNLVFNDKSLLNTKARISSVAGNRIADVIISNYNQSIDLSKYPKGIYILSLSNGQSLKLIKN